MAAGYVLRTAGSVALTAATAKTVVNVIAAANTIFRICELSVSFDGVTASAVPATVDLCYSTQAGAGTPGTSPAPTQFRGPTRTVQATGGLAYSAEPTVLTVLKSWLVPVFNGLFLLQFPLGREPEQIVTADAFCLSGTATAVVNVQGYIEIEEG
jgi:hypothetical protein